MANAAPLTAEPGDAGLAAALAGRRLSLRDLLPVGQGWSWPLLPPNSAEPSAWRLVFSDAQGEVAEMGISSAVMGRLGLSETSPLPLLRVLSMRYLEPVWPAMRVVFGDALSLELSRAAAPDVGATSAVVFALELPGESGVARCVIGPRHGPALVGAALRRAAGEAPRHSVPVQLDTPLRLDPKSLAALSVGDVLVGDMHVASGLGYTRLALAAAPGTDRSPRGVAWVRPEDGKVEQLIPAVAARGLPLRRTLAGVAVPLEVVYRRFELPMDWTDLKPGVSISGGRPLALDPVAMLYLNGEVVAELAASRLAGRQGFEVLALTKARRATAAHR